MNRAADGPEGMDSVSVAETRGRGRLADMTALITGGTTGIGFAIAERFLAEDARVVVTGRDSRLGRRAETVLRRSGPALSCWPMLVIRPPCRGRSLPPSITWAAWTCW